MVSVSTLQKMVGKILISPRFMMLLQSRSIEIAQISESKQTETTQRWKIQLKNQTGLTIPTKIEFSRRNLDSPIEFEPIDSSVLNTYHLHPIFVPHYGPEIAFKQTIIALASRSETQARDIWDLFHLINAYGVKNWDEKYVKQACENACTISYSDFKDQVLAFFPPDLQKQYNQEAWDQIQLKVIEYLEGPK
jgi:predicted nucleotidyltransferase component of viral defense system